MLEQTIQIDQTIKAEPAMVWDAISNPENMKEWYFDIPEFSPEVGCQFEWWAGPPDGNKWLHRGKVDEVNPGSRLCYTWEYPGYEGLGRCIWQLNPISEHETQLHFTFEFLTPFQTDQPELRSENFVAGWNSIVKELLPGHVVS